MVARIPRVVIAATLAFAVVPASADIVPPDRHGEIPMPAPRPDPGPKPAPAPQPLPPKPAPEKEAAAPFVAIGFLALFALLCLWLSRRPGEQSA